jgi:hypothetical protein
MGLEAFGAAMAEMEAEYSRRFAEAERPLPPCVTCGRSRDLRDDLRRISRWLGDEVRRSPRSSLDDEVRRSPLCDVCANEEWEREHPSFRVEDPPAPTPEDDDDDMI